MAGVRRHVFIHSLTGAALALAALCLPAAPLRALPPDATLARDFAYCAGRLSAEAARTPREDIRALRDAMEDLLSAVVPPGETGAYEKLRIAGHVSQSGLLAEARFSLDHEVAERAARLADQRLAECRAMLLGG
ncbi:hypothetical protein [Celeribacter indicus]|uniref:Twin-arginine translocation pathway signal n=1 Tax=Celeribacter indicus TaxID=1208324 RepID=A0A0B5E6F4_9RHOB|nr:hypothetical protein [Celeribacter indicus]AJE47902.1 hypothetical protein P73_3187 [Celeribacter indicus]SDW26476.1 hypothetical protein SAMN05443573_102176 [Celeribacter indicus]